MASKSGSVTVDDAFIGEAVYANNLKTRIGIIVEIDPLRDNGMSPDYKDFTGKVTQPGTPYKRGAFKIKWHDGTEDWHMAESHYGSHTWNPRSVAHLIAEKQADVDKYAEKALNQINKAAVHAGFLPATVLPKKTRKTSAKKAP